ncbi:MAG: ABC transporter substrate-binding protein [Acidimicrobiia bacterium]
MKFRWLAAAVAVALGVSLTATTAVAQSSSGDKPTATDVGITATEIHVAAIADVDNAIAPNLFKASVDAVNGWAKYVNANGGLAGRKVVVDFYDSKLNPTETRNSEIKACENDVAAVGTSAVFLTSVDDMRNCKDKDGAVTGLPDIPFVSTAIVQQCSDQSFPIAPPQIICSTKDQHPQTYQADVARGRYYNKKYGQNKLHGVYIYGSDSKSAHDSQVASLGALTTIGIKSDANFDTGGRDPQSAYTPIVQAIKSNSSNFAACGGAFTCTVNLRKEATLQGISGVDVWDCGVSCYDKQFIEAGGSDVEGNYVDTLFLPFYNKADVKANKELAAFVKYTGSNAASFGAYAWAAGEAFAQAVNAQVKAGGNNSVTRKTIFEQLNKINKFDANGMMAPIDLAGRKVSNCSVTMQVKNGNFVRVEPTKPGTFNCPSNGTVTQQLDLIK